MTVRFNKRGTPKRLMLQSFLVLSYMHFQFLLLNVSPKTIILTFKQTKKAMTPTPSAFAIYVNYGDQSFVHECIFIERFRFDLPCSEGSTFPREIVCVLWGVKGWRGSKFHILMQQYLNLLK